MNHKNVDHKSISLIIDEFALHIPAHIEQMPLLSPNGTTRREMESKYIIRAMATEIIRLRHTTKKDVKK